MSPQEVRFEYFKSRGPGGQHKNKRRTAVRAVHTLTGISGAGRKERSQAQNKEAALAALTEKLALRNTKAPPRIPTRRSRAARERMLAWKQQRGFVKRERSLRRAPDEW